MRYYEVDIRNRIELITDSLIPYGTALIKENDLREALKEIAEFAFGLGEGENIVKLQNQCESDMLKLERQLKMEYQKELDLMRKDDLQSG